MASQSYQAIQDADIVFFMVDVGAGITNGDRMIAQHLRRSGKDAYLVANKIDGKNPDLVLTAADQANGIEASLDLILNKLQASF